MEDTYAIVVKDIIHAYQQQMKRQMNKVCCVASRRSAGFINSRRPPLGALDSIRARRTKDYYRPWTCSFGFGYLNISVSDKMTIIGLFRFKNICFFKTRSYAIC